MRAKPIISFPVALLLIWIVIFFPKWYSLTFIKVSELRQMVGQNRSTQLQALYPPVMDQLLILREQIQAYPPSRTAVVLTNEALALPLGGNGAVLRAMMHPYQVVSPSESSRYSHLFILRLCESLADSLCWELQL